MLTEPRQSRSLLILGICAPLALLLGYMLAEPLTLGSLGIVALVLLLLSLPLLLRWHYPLLAFCWNATLIFFFLPGQPPLWGVIACLSLFISVLGRTITKTKQSTFIRVPSVEWPLIVMAVVVIVTIQFTGGIGGRALGTENWGGKRYIGVLAAIIGYFAFIARPIAPQRAALFAGMFFLSGITAIFSDLAYAAGPDFYFLFALFSPDVAAAQARSLDILPRSTGLAWMAQAGGCFMLLRYGIRGLLVWQRPWRLLIYIGLLFVGLLGGFRTTVVVTAMLFCCQFYYEGLLRSRLLPILLVSGLLGGALLVGYVDRLPLVVQRSLSILPLKVDLRAKQDAASTIDWRLQIWKIVLPDVPKYLLLGKGFNFSGTDLLLTQEAMRRGYYSSLEPTLIIGNYHSGPLTILIPFGLFGALAFAAFCWASLRVLRANYRYGDAPLKKINTFLLANFIARLLFYLIFYGQFELDLMVFTGTVGLSVAINGGVKKPVLAPETRFTEPLMGAEVTRAAA